MIYDIQIKYRTARQREESFKWEQIVFFPVQVESNQDITTKAIEFINSLFCDYSELSEVEEIRWNFEGSPQGHYVFVRPETKLVAGYAAK